MGVDCRYYGIPSGGIIILIGSGLQGFVLTLLEGGLSHRADALAYDVPQGYWALGVMIFGILYVQQRVEAETSMPLYSIYSAPPGNRIYSDMH